MGQRSAALTLASAAEPGHQLRIAQPVQRQGDGVEVVVQVLGVRVDVEQAGDDLAGRLALMQMVHRADPVGRVVILVQLAQAEDGAVVLRHLPHLARGVVGGDRLAAEDDVELVHRLVMLADEVVALRRAVVVVEGDAGADAVDEGRALVAQRRLDQRHQLRLVAGEAAGDEGGAELQRDADQVDRLVGVDRALLGLGALVGGRGELALGQAVDPVVLDDVGHVDAAADAVGELAEADRGAVAVAGDAEIDQLPVGEVGAGQHRRHAAMHRVEAVRGAQEVVRRLRRAADAGHLGDAVRLDIQLEAGLDDGGARCSRGRSRRRAC